MQRHALRRAGCIAYALLQSFMFGACEARAPEPTLAAVRPDVVSNLVATPIIVEGTGFVEVPAVDLGARSSAKLRAEYRVRVGDVYTADGLKPESAELLQLELPAGLSPGQYDIEVVPPLGATLVLPRALTIRDDRAEAETRKLSLETLANGAGDLVTGQTLSMGEEVELFAVFRAEDGRFITAEQPVRFTLDPAIGALSETYAPQTQVTALFPGELVLRARADTGELAEALLHVQADPTRGLADYRLAIEDASAGAGAAVGPALTSVAGTQHELYAVVRTSSGEFVLDLPVTWSVSGAQTEPDSVSAGLSLQLQAAGETTVTASYPGLDPVSVRVQVLPAVAAKLVIVPDMAGLRAGEPAVTFAVNGEDAYGNGTADVGELSFAVVDGDFGELDAATGTLTPLRAGVGHVSVRSSLGATATSGTIEVKPGPLSRLSLATPTLSLSADAAPVQLQALGWDAYGNGTSELGQLTWAVATGPLGILSADGLLDPVTAGVGTISATSSLGPSVESATVEITAGRAQTLGIQPQSWSGVVGDPPLTFTATGVDADGNVTADVGSVSFRVATGSIGLLDPASGVLTPATPGEGTIEAQSAYGLRASTQQIVIAAQAALVRISDMRLAGDMWSGRRAARLEVDIVNDGLSAAVLTGLDFSFLSAFFSSDLTDDYVVVADNENDDHVAAGASVTLVYHVDPAGVSSSFGSVTLSAAGEAYPTSGPATALSKSIDFSRQTSFTYYSLSIDGPLPPLDRACTGTPVQFEASDTALSLFSSPRYEWSFPGGMLAPGSALDDAAPEAIYAQVGSFPYSVSATYYGLRTTALGTPVYIGTVESGAASYPTGHVVLSSPRVDQSVSLAGFPRSDLVTVDPALPLRQCDGTAIDSTGRRVLTLFSDRGLVDPAADIDPAEPGIQVAINAAGTLDSLPLRAPAQRLEGSTTLYFEYFEPNSGAVTAAGDATFRLTGDNQAPSVLWTHPASDCASACMSPGESLYFQFSEPMSVQSLSSVSVQLYSGSSCVGSPSSDLTSSSAVSYDADSAALKVTPPARSGTYAIAVRLPSSVTDASVARNALPQLSRCVVWSSLPSPQTPAAPQLSAAPGKTFSPDGDGASDTMSWSVSVDAAASLLQLRVKRGGQTVLAQLRQTPQPGQYTLVWDGSDRSGRIVNDGAYSFDIRAINSAGATSAPLVGYVEVDSAVHMVSVRRRQ